MLDVLNRYAHGFVAIPTILACRETRVFETLSDQGPLSKDALSERLRANAGHLAVALRLLESLGWISRDERGEFSLNIDRHVYDEIPQDSTDWWSFPIAAYLTGEDESLSIRPWLDRCQASWHVSEHRTAQMLDGVFAVPLLSALRSEGLLLSDVDKHGPVFCSKTDGLVRAELSELFRHLDWAREQNQVFKLTELGRFVCERALILGTLYAYVPMLSQLTELLIGDPQNVFRRDEQGHERHIERTLNVVASGFQHEKYFADVEEIIVSLFDSMPVECQPNYVADMGCGDGTFLKRIFDVVASRTARGNVLDERPLTMIGVDFNDKALQATKKTLDGIPNLVLQGDIGDPQRLMQDLAGAGITNRDEVLHIRSFLDHDRPLAEPHDTVALQRRSSFPYEGVFVNAQGDAIKPAVAIQSLVEHLAGWTEVATGHGLIVLEVHSVPPDATKRFLEESESLHFDAYHGYSMQYLVDADQFIMSAAEVGLFSKLDFFRRYPKTLPYCRITLSWFERRPYTIRNALPDDMARIQQLRNSANSSVSAVSENTLRAVVAVDPLSSFVVERGDRVVGAAICQRIVRIDGISDINPQDYPALRDRHGEVFQIVDLVVHQNQEREELEAELLRFVLQQAHLKAGITSLVAIVPCENDDQIHALRCTGEICDPRLKLYESCGAKYSGVHSDGGSSLHRAMMLFDFQDAKRPESQSEIQPADANENGNDVASLVDDSIQRLLEHNDSTYSTKKTLYELGLDSLDHMELASTLAKRLDIELDSSVLFKYDTPDKLSAYLRKRTTSRTKLGSIFSLLGRS